MLQGKANRSYQKVFLNVVSFIDWSKEYKKTVPMTRMDTRCSEIVANMTGEMGWKAGGKENLDSQEGRVNEFKILSVRTFEEQRDYSMYILKYLHLITWWRMYEDLERCRFLRANQTSNLKCISSRHV